MRRTFWTVMATAGVALGACLFSLSSTATPVPTTYVALGDSVAAGAGLSASDTVCDQSTQSYPYLFARELGISVNQLACSGAKLDEGVYSEQERGGVTIESQLSRAFDEATPDIVTMTAGANDARWARFIAQCYRFSCGHQADDVQARVYLADVRLELNTVMAMVHREADGTPPPVLVTGYYSPLPPDECRPGSGLTAKEITWLDNKTKALNRAIKEVVSRYSFAYFVPVDFSGRSLCSSSSWIQGLSGGAPFHPTESGQAAIARAVSDAYSQIDASQRNTKASSLRERALNWVSRYYN